MNLSCIPERKKNKVHINVSSKQEMQKFKNQEYSKFFHTYCNADHARDISDRLSFTSTDPLFNGEFVDWCSRENLRPLESASTHKQEQCTHEY